MHSDKKYSPALGSLHRTWPSMKIKFLFLLIILAGIIIISGCVDREDQPLTSKAPENMYRSIFYPNAELQDHGGPGIPDEHRHDSSEEPGCEPIHNLREATFLLDRNIEKAEFISARLEEGIQRSKAEGKDVSKLEDLLVKYNLLVEEARKYRSLADTAVDEENNSSITNSDLENCSFENTKREYLIRSQKSMIQANIVLKEIFNEFQRLMPGSEEINKTSILSAAGEGKVSLIGNFTLNMHLEKGDIVIPDLSKDSEIYLTGDYFFEERSEMQDDVLRLYHIHSADVKISGSRKTVLLRGSNISLTAADGEGYAVFRGNGTYRIENAGEIIKEQNWADPFPKEGTNPEKYGPDEKDNDKSTGNSTESNIFRRKQS